MAAAAAAAAAATAIMIYGNNSVIVIIVAIIETIIITTKTTRVRACVRACELQCLPGVCNMSVKYRRINCRPLNANCIPPIAYRQSLTADHGPLIGMAPQQWRVHHHHKS